MTLTKSTLNNRFGYGIQPNMTNMSSVSNVLSDLAKPDFFQKQFNRPSFKQRLNLFNKLQKARKDEQQNKTGSMQSVKDIQKIIRTWVIKDVHAFISKAALSENGFKERLVAFWNDHFTVSGRNQELMLAHGAYIDEAIRPNIAGKFSDILKASATHPAMLLYLDQHNSIGPNSIAGKKQKRGLNENLAREILELHTLGVGGSYSQNDVRQFAELLTGLTIGKVGSQFNPRFSEPGKKTILGNSYGTNKPNLQPILDFLDDLSIHQETAHHIAKKLAIHFVSENPSKILVKAIRTAFIKSGGELMALYEAMLNHPDSAMPLGDKVKWPIQYVISSIRALNLSQGLSKASDKELIDIHSAMLKMGQDLFRPSGPDGWSEAASYWITPPNLAARIEWAGGLANEHGQGVDPRILIKQVLGDSASEQLIYAVGDTESKWEGVALLLISPEFNRH